ncbi:MAG: hypothetical protein FWC03_07820 [Treponema sp.]|nr:hypothetical protein [Treponema sp.]
MKKFFTGALVLMFILAGTTAFAQSSDSDYVDVNEGVPVETFVGFQFNMDFQKVNNWDTKAEMNGKMLIPSINIGARGYLAEPGDTGIQIGVVIMLNYGFVNQTMDGWKPSGSNYNYMMNMGGLLGGTLRAHIGDSGLAFVADAGILLNMDMASYDWWYYYTSNPSLTYKGKREYSEMNFGIGITPALQYHLPLVGKMNLIFEFGANLGLGFIAIQNETKYMTNGDEYSSNSGLMSDYGPRIRIGPYLNVGVNF